MDNKEEQMSGNDDGSPNSQGVHHPQGPHAGIQMQIQQQQQTHMLNQGRGQCPRHHQRFDHGTIVGSGQGSPRIPLPFSLPLFLIPPRVSLQAGPSGSIGVGNAISGQEGMFQQSCSTSTHDLGHRELIQQQLVLLLHAEKCQLRERQANGEGRICALPHCKAMKNVLTHMTNCEEGEECTVPYCSSSRQIITHWKQCQKSDCPVCLPIRQANKNNAANSCAAVAASQRNPNPDIRIRFDTMGIIQGQKTTSGVIPNQAVGRDVRMPGPGMQGPPGSMAAGIRLAQPQAQQSPGQSVVNQGQLIAPNVSVPLSSDPTTAVVSTSQPASTTGPTSAVAAAAATVNLQQQAVNMLPGGFQATQVTKEWHKSVTPDLRNHLVHKLDQAVFPALDSHAMFHKRLQNLVAYAKKADGNMYEMAQPRFEYCYLLAEKIYKVEKILEEKYRKRREKQLAQQQQQQQQSQQQQDDTSIPNDVSTIPQVPSAISTLLPIIEQQQFTNTRPLPATTPVDNGISVNTPQTIPPASSGPSPGPAPTTNDPQPVASTSSTPHNNKENIKMEIKQKPMEESSADGTIKEEPHIKEETVIPMSRLYQDPESLLFRQPVHPPALGTNTTQILCGYGKQLCTILRDAKHYSCKNSLDNF